MKVCIYGSASQTLEEKYYTETEKLGRLLGAKGHTLVFGGGRHGMMGAAVRGFMAEGAETIAVVPTFFSDDVIQDGCTKYVRHETMRERKAYFEENSDVFIVTPGGIGTFEEFFEVLTLCSLGRMDKRIVIFNQDGYYSKLLGFMKDAADAGFIAEKVAGLYTVYDTAEEVAENI